MKYTHIGLQDQADALAGLPFPRVCTNADWMVIGRVSGGVLGQEVSADVSKGGREGKTKSDKTPSEEGVSSFLVTDFQEVSVDVTSGGGGNCTRVPRFINASIYVRSRSFDCRPRGPGRQGPLRLILS
jgi:hypothetical protein